MPSTITLKSRPPSAWNGVHDGLKYAREVSGLPIEAWAEACRIAASPASLTNTAETLPSVRVLKDRLAATA